MSAALQQSKELQVANNAVDSVPKTPKRPSGADKRVMDHFLTPSSWAMPSAMSVSSHRALEPQGQGTCTYLGSQNLVGQPPTDAHVKKERAKIQAALKTSNCVLPT